MPGGHQSGWVPGRRLTPNHRRRVPPAPLQHWTSKDRWIRAVAVLQERTYIGERGRDVQEVRERDRRAASEHFGERRERRQGDGGRSRGRKKQGVRRHLQDLALVLEHSKNPTLARSEGGCARGRGVKVDSGRGMRGLGATEKDITRPLPTPPGLHRYRHVSTSVGTAIMARTISVRRCRLLQFGLARGQERPATLSGPNSHVTACAADLC